MELITKNGNRGFTLIELLIVITIIGILLTIAQPTYKNSVKRARETVLKENLFAMRSAIDQYYADNGTYPGSLEDLVQKGYLRSIPRDPITNSNTTWIIVPPPNPEETGVYDVKSGSNEISLSGTPYSDW
ncbi:MAG: prepilin-type N-terminal cleavage/methylation domain-containing protein [Proteobacteria bacterium]|nr:prepilin-type N-terminal cleavage/methylation domain-containing protein [Pseudomonadota bacterium]